MMAWCEVGDGAGEMMGMALMAGLMMLMSDDGEEVDCLIYVWCTNYHLLACIAR